MAILLVIDDEPNVLYSLETCLRSDELEVITADTGALGIELAQQYRPDVVLLDVRLGDRTGLEVCEQLQRLDPRLPIILITAYSTTETAIEAMKRGAFDYLLKPVDFLKLQEVIRQALAVGRMARVPALYREDDVTSPNEGDRIIGRSLLMQEVYKAIGRIAPQQVTVLIEGESGTGKELVARSIYQHSARVGGPFLAINCAAIPENLLESELFGHEKGAFTGAERRRIGKFEQADGGTLLLDEIADMSATTQAKVLRLLQEQRFERVGGNETIQVDVRVIAATNQHLQTAVAEGRFRQDLFYRLNGFTIRLPALRERPEDIALLVEYFVQVFQRALKTRVDSISEEAMSILKAHDWPGNVRELQNVIRYAMVHARSNILTPECLPELVRRSVSEPSAGLSENKYIIDLNKIVWELLQAGDREIYRKASQQADRVILQTVLNYVGGNQVQASEILGISRTTLRARMRALQMLQDKGNLPEPACTSA